MMVLESCLHSRPGTTDALVHASVLLAFEASIEVI